MASESGPSNQNIPFAVPHAINPSPYPFINQGGGSAFEFGELEEAIVLQGVQIGHHEPKSYMYRGSSSSSSRGAPAATLEMFPSWPMRFHQTTRGSSKSGESTDSVNTMNSSKGEGQMEPESPINQQASSSYHLQIHHQPDMATDSSPTTTTAATTTTSLNQSALKLPSEKGQVTTRSGKVLDSKTLRRLAQNREAARKSRLRKKAYVQQLESSRMKLAQLEHDLQRARSQGLFLGEAGGAPANLTSGATIFDMEYARWLDDDNKHMAELRTALQAQLSDGELRFIVDGYMNHFDDVFRLRGAATKVDVFHLTSGTWTSPAERCFLWMGGFRPSDLIKMLVGQLDPLTEQQVMGIYSLQRSSQQAEEALSLGLEQLQQSLVDTIACSSNVTDAMQQMGLALAKLSNLEGFVCQADNLRQQTLHQLMKLLTVRQAARCFLLIGEYYGRLRALSSLWVSRPRDPALMNEENSSQAARDMQMLQPPHNPFSHF